VVIEGSETRRIFDEFDVDGNGSIDREDRSPTPLERQFSAILTLIRGVLQEFQQLCFRLGVPMTSAQVSACGGC